MRILVMLAADGRNEGVKYPCFNNSRFEKKAYFVMDKADRSAFTTP